MTALSLDLGFEPYLFVDIKNQRLDKEAASMMTTLKDVTIPKRLSTSNCKRFNIDWTSFKNTE